MGAKYLQQTLNEQLGKHIKEKLPGIRTRIQQKIHDLKATLQDLGHIIWFPSGAPSYNHMMEISTIPKFFNQ